ncbi:MAG: hypothetical protein ACOZIN_01485 [Myxococcota bacterium]
MKPEALQAQLLEELARHPVPESPWRRARVLGGAQALMVVAAAGFAWAHPPLHVFGSALGNAMELSLLLLLAAGGPLAAVLPGMRGLRTALLVAAGLALVLPLAMHNGVGAEGPLFASGAPCAALLLGFSVVPAVAVVWSVKAFAFQPLRVLVGAASSGAAGQLALALHCPTETAPHLSLFHLLPWVVVALVVTAVRSRVKSETYVP